MRPEAPIRRAEAALAAEGVHTLKSLSVDNIVEYATSSICRFFFAERNPIEAFMALPLYHARGSLDRISALRGSLDAAHQLAYASCKRGELHGTQRDHEPNILG
jgi:hypothetical protein